MLKPMKYPILHSGFIGMTETGLTKKIPQTPTFSDTILFAKVNHEYDNLFYSSDITDLFKEWQGDPHAIKKFDFREKVLRQALNKFNPSMLEWLAFQSGKPGFTRTHKQLLVRMCSWMSEDNCAPEMPAEALKWINLIGPDQGNDVKFTVNETTAGANLSTVNAIHRWVAKEGGFESLLVYLYIVFGERVGHTQKPGFVL